MSVYTYDRLAQFLRDHGVENVSTYPGFGDGEPHDWACVRAVNPTDGRRVIAFFNANTGRFQNGLIVDDSTILNTLKAVVDTVLDGPVIDLEWAA